MRRFHAGHYTATGTEAKLLVVDDDSIDFLSTAMRFAGFTTSPPKTAAAHCKEAGLAPDLIVLDVAAPRHGHAVTRRLRDAGIATVFPHRPRRVRSGLTVGTTTTSPNPSASRVVA